MIWPALLLLLAPSSLPSPPQFPATRSDNSKAAYESGMRLLRQKQYAEALEQFRREEQLAPNESQGPTGEGIALALLGRLSDAAEALRRALRIDPSDWMPRRELGIVEWQLHQKDEAAKDLQEIVKLFPTDQPVNSMLGQYELQRKNYSQASIYFAAAPAEVARSHELMLMAAEALLKSGHGEEATKHLAELRNRVDLMPDEKFRLGWLLGEAREYHEAIEVFNSIPSDYPDPLKLSYGLALANFESGNYSKCITTLKDHTNAGDTNASVLSLLGVAQEKNGHTEEALSTFRRGIELFPADDECYLDLSTLAAVHLNYELPLPYLSSAIEKIPNDYKLFLTRGLLRNLKGRHDLALADYEKALNLAPDQSSIYVSMGMCYEDQNKYADAMAILQRAVQLQTKDVLVYYFLAEAMFREGLTSNSPQYDQARSVVESALKVDPGYALAYTQRAKLEMMVNRIDAAITDLEYARSLDPGAPSIAYQLGMAYRRAGRAADASKLLASVVEANKKELDQERVRTLEGIMVQVSSPKAAAP